MKYVQIVFSPTGGTLKAAEAVTGQWSENVDTIDLTDPNKDFSEYSLEKDDIVLIAVPAYGGRVPAVAAERIKKLNGGGAKCTLLCVYGNRAYEDTLVEMEDIAKVCGFSVKAAIAAIAEHSIVRKYAAGRPDTNDVKKLKEFAETALKKVCEENSYTDLKLVGNRPYKKSSGGGLTPKVGENCVKCGLCAKECPVQAISVENVAISDTEKCISCMRCVTVCPHSARNVNKAMLTAVSLMLKGACSERKECEIFC